MTEGFFNEFVSRHDIQVVGLAGTIVLAVFILPMGVFGLGANGITACVLFRAKSFKCVLCVQQFESYSGR